MFQHLPKSLIKLPLKKRFLSYTISFRFCNEIKNIKGDATSRKYLQIFQNLMMQNTQQSLSLAAEMMAQIEFKVQQQEEEITQMQKVLQDCPSQTKALISKIQKVLENIQYQKKEIQGIQRRTQKQIQDCKNYSVGSIAKEVLDVADSLNRCYKHALETDNSDHKQLISTYKKPIQQLKTIFQIYGIRQFDPTGQTYDPNKQQAVANVPITDGKATPNTVAFTSRTGYTIKGRLLRSAHVGVFQ